MGNEMTGGGTRKKRKSSVCRMGGKSVEEKGKDERIYGKNAGTGTSLRRSWQKAVGWVEGDEREDAWWMREMEEGRKKMVEEEKEKERKEYPKEEISGKVRGREKEGE